VRTSRSACREVGVSRNESSECRLKDQVVLPAAQKKVAHGFAAGLAIPRSQQAREFVTFRAEPHVIPDHTRRPLSLPSLSPPAQCLPILSLSLSHPPP
jgi:hypothetical protein